MLKQTHDDSRQIKDSLWRTFLWNYAQLRNRHILALDIVIFLAAPLLALALRLDGFHATLPLLGGLTTYTFISVLVHTLVFGYGKLYNRYWRYATVEDVVPILKGIVTSTFFMYLLYEGMLFSGILPKALPRAFPLLEGILIFSLSSTMRFGMRLAMHLLKQVESEGFQNVLIVGDGETAQSMVRDLASHARLGMNPIGFLSEEANRVGLRLLNRPILGKVEDLVEVVLSNSVSKVIIAMPGASGKTVRQIHDLCERAKVPVQTVPRMADIIEGKVNVSQLRNIELEDLLRRDPIRTDTVAVREFLSNKRVLVTGAGGSIGGELCRQILDAMPSHLALMGHGENSIFEMYNELLERRKHLTVPIDSDSKSYDPTRIMAYIADIRFAQRVRNVVEEFRPDVIFHAAAHKHVPLMEWNPGEAITNNVFGTQNLLDAAQEFNVKHVVMISTDKAVNPTSVMGCSKRVAEQVVMDAARQSGNAYVAVRFGNVLGSRGSVVLTFKKQIAAGGPVTVSHPDMRRFFMTIPEAVQLVLQAAVLGKGGEVFMLDMGEPVRIIDLAKDLIELSGLEVGKDVEIVCTGIRPGEKLFEELFIEGETYHRTRHDKIIHVKNASQFVSPRLHPLLADMQRALREDDRANIIQSLQELVPEFSPDEARLPNPAPTPTQTRTNDTQIMRMM